MKRFLIVIVAATSGCQKPDVQNQALLFNADSLIKAQVVNLQMQTNELHKTTTVDGMSHETLLPKNIDWAKELDPFNALSIINKPTYRTAYSESVTKDPKSNLTIKTWTSNLDAPIQSLTLYYLDSPDQLWRLEAILIEDNSIFTSSRSLTMRFNSLVNPSRLEKYEIAGHQKFFWGEYLSYSLTGTIQSQIKPIK